MTSINSLGSQKIKICSPIQFTAPFSKENIVAYVQTYVETESTWINNYISWKITYATRFYSATKFALCSLTESWRQELRENGSTVRIHCLCPGKKVIEKSCKEKIMKIINQRGKWITKFKKIGIKLISTNLHTMHLCFVFFTY